MNILLLVLLSAVLWLSHRVVCTKVAKKLKTTKNDSFRFVHALLMGLLLIITLTIYGKLQTALIGFIASFVIVIGTVLALDLLNHFYIKKLKLDLDIGHYLTGYAVIATVLFVL